MIYHKNKSFMIMESEHNYRGETFYTLHLYSKGDTRYYECYDREEALDLVRNAFDIYNDELLIKAIETMGYKEGEVDLIYRIGTRLYRVESNRYSHVIDIDPLAWEVRHVINGKPGAFHQISDYVYFE